MRADRESSRNALNAVAFDPPERARGAGTAAKSSCGAAGPTAAKLTVWSGISEDRPDSKRLEDSRNG